MQKSTFILLVFLGVSSQIGWGCRNEDIIRPDWFDQGWGEVSAFQNGTLWSNTGASAVFIKQVDIFPCVERRVGLVFFQFSKDGLQRQLLSFTGLQPVAGQHVLTERVASDCTPVAVSASFSTSQDDGDVGKSVYSLDLSNEHYLCVTAYDSSRRLISGTFKASFIKQAKYVNDDPVKISFENGRFSTLVAEKGRFE